MASYILAFHAAISASIAEQKSLTSIAASLVGLVVGIRFYFMDDNAHVDMADRAIVCTCKLYRFGGIIIEMTHLRFATKHFWTDPEGVLTQI
jgi:hypothetical protein